MRKPLSLQLILGIVLLSTSTASADEGMWLFNKLPTIDLKERYNFQPTAQWLEHVQKSCVRFSTGGSGSIISANGLVMTNHHVGADNLSKFSTPQRNLLETGFFAKTPAEELKCEDLELNVLWSMEDVTDRVKGAAQPTMSSADANTARRQMMSVIEDEAGKKTGLDCEVVTLYQGGMYHLYSYKRYTDVRLVMAPEEAIAFFGGDNDNFEYPRYDLDMCFFRIYENGKPLKAEHYLRWSADGSREGDLAIVTGHPGRTQRLYTLDHLKFLRDVEVPFVLRSLWRREVQLQTFAGRDAEQARIAGDDLSGVQNSRKAYHGIMEGLLDPNLFRRKSREENALKNSVNDNSENRSTWGDAWDQITKAQATYREFHVRYNLLEGRRRALRSDLFTIAKHLVRLAEEKPKPSAERLREYRDSEMDSLLLELYSPAPIYENLEIDRIAGGLSALAENLGGDDPLVMKALGKRPPHDRAVSLVTNSQLKAVQVRKTLVEGGKDALMQSGDPMIALAMTLEQESLSLRKRYEDEVESAEREGYAKIAAARFAQGGENNYPDATFTLRFAYGPIKGYTEDEKTIPPYTTIAGAYERSQQRKGETAFELPQRWLERKNSLKLDTPFNFVCTADIIGGNSGSPVINTKGDVIGLVFDGNLQSLIWDIYFTEMQGRAVSVDSRAIIECLRKVYDAGALADEITGK